MGCLVSAAYSAVLYQQSVFRSRGVYENVYSLDCVKL